MPGRCMIPALAGRHADSSLTATSAQVAPAYSRGSVSMRTAVDVFSATNCGGRHRLLSPQTVVAPTSRGPDVPRKPDTLLGRNPGDVMGRGPVTSRRRSLSKAKVLRGRGLRRGAEAARNPQAVGRRGVGAGDGSAGAAATRAHCGADGAARPARPVPSVTYTPPQAKTVRWATAVPMSGRMLPSSGNAPPAVDVTTRSTEGGDPPSSAVSSGPSRI